MCGGASVLRRVDNSEIRGACRILIHDTLGTIILSIVDQDDFQLILREPLVEHGVESLREGCQGGVHGGHHRYEWLILIRAARHAPPRICASWSFHRPRVLMNSSRAGSRLTSLDLHHYKEPH